jgi:RNA polymerase sigma factor (sigma-70 family)
MSIEQTYRQLGEAFYQRRTEKTYNALYKKVRPGLKNYIWNILKDEEAVDDVLSNTLVKLWTKIDQYNPEYQITTWLYRIAFNESLGYIRERNKKQSLDNIKEFGIEVSESNEMQSNSIAALMESVELKTEEDFWEEDNEIMHRYLLALKCIDGLKPMYREILADRLINRMKYEEIAQKYNLPIQTIKNRIRRAKILVIEAMES